MRNSANTAYRNLYTSDNASSGAGQPATTNVRSGTVYGPTNEYTGTCAVPAAGSVALGVAVDNTTGTAILTAANVQTALTSQGLTTTRAGYLDNLDATVSSRSTYAGGDTSGTTTLLSRLTSTRAGYLDNISTAPPSAATIAAAVWSAATRTLTAAIDQSSTIASAVWSTATRTVTGGTVDTASNAPSASTIATAVWASLTSGLTTVGSIGKLLADNVNATISSAAADSSGVTTLLGRLTSGRASALDNLDATVSSRLAGSGYTTPPTVTQIRTELDTNSTKLANLDATVSSRLAGASYSAPPSAASIRAEIDSNSTKLDTTISSRLAAASYSAPLDAAGTRNAVGLTTGNLDTQLSGISSGISGLPSASAIASAVWAAASRTLTTAIDNSSTIAAAVWSAVSRTITGGVVDTLTNAPTVPTPSQIASQVRTELSTELGRIDTSVSSRLAPSGTLARVTLTDTATTLTNAPDVPSAPEIAEAVRTELTPELTRVSNAATTQEVSDIVEGAG